MTTDQLAALSTRDFSKVAAQVLGAVLDRVPLDRQKPEWVEMLLALHLRSKSAALPNAATPVSHVVARIAPPEMDVGAEKPRMTRRRPSRKFGEIDGS